MSSCKKYLILLSDYLENELAQEDRQILEKHFHDCPNCRNFFDSFRSSVELVQYLETEPCPPDVATRLDRAVMEKLKQKQTQEEAPASSSENQGEEEEA